MPKTTIGKVVFAIGLLIVILSAMQSAEVMGKAAKWVSLAVTVLSAVWVYLSKLLEAAPSPPVAPKAKPDA